MCDHRTIDHASANDFLLGIDFGLLRQKSTNVSKGQHWSLSSEAVTPPDEMKGLIWPSRSSFLPAPGN
jgi:hypothetical protein